MAKKRDSKKIIPDADGGLFAPLESQPEATHAKPAKADAPKIESAVVPSPSALDPFRLTDDQREALDLTRNRVISASAGTGKTHTLCALYLALLEGRLSPGGKLLDEEEWLKRARAGTLSPMRPGDIVAVTFTEKAAAELLERTRAALERELQRDLPDALREHLTRCRMELFGAPVSTIHAFCARLLREAGADGPVPAAFTVLEADEAAELFNDALSLAAAEMLDSGEFPNVQKLAQENGVFTPRSGLLDTARSLADALRTRGLPSSALLPRGATPLKTIHAWLEAFYDAVAAVPDKNRSKPKPELRTLCAARELPDSFEAARLLTLKIMPLIKFVWFENSDSIDNPFNRILEACHAPYAEALATFVERAQRGYAEAKRKAGHVDFDDLMLACKALLETEKERRARTDIPADGAAETSAYRFVLIDEYQDTNPLQNDILRGVAFPNGDTSGTPRLAVVGDIKQSIYRFRGADVTLMESAIAEHAVAALRANFRSRRRVTAFFNELFAFVWPGGNGRFAYDAKHQFEAGDDDIRHKWDDVAGEVITWPKEEECNAERHRQNQAFAIARRIRTLVAPATQTELTRPLIFDKGATEARAAVRYGDIAILARSLKHLRVPLQIAFALMRIPFRILKGMSFFTRPEIIDVTNLWAVACDSNDSFSLAGLLRSPFVGMSDAGLWRVTGGVECQVPSAEYKVPSAECRVPSVESQVSAATKASLSELVLSAAANAKVLTGWSGDDLLALERAASILTQITAWRGRRTAVEILDWALTETGFLSVQALQPHGEVAVAAVRKAIELARAFETRGNRHLSDFVRWMRTRADAEWDDAGAAGQDISADLPTDENSVQIGTIHSAKGLEFPIVFFADAGAISPPNNAWATFSTEHGMGLRLGSEFDGVKAAADAIHAANAEKTKAEENAERLRLLYVALTRAREYLVIVGDAGTGETNWRRLIDAYRVVNPNALAEVSASHPELKEVSKGDVSGLLTFENGVARVRDELNVAPQSDATVHVERAQTESAASAEIDVRVSVSRLALWLWCPRRAAFAAWEADNSARPADSVQGDVPSQDGEDAQSGLDVDDAEVAESGGGSDARALGTAVHAALETIFGAREPFSPQTEARAAERFTRELAREEAPDDPDMKRTFERALALARSDWGRRILALDSEHRSVETPFKWRIAVSPTSHVTVFGQLDLLIKLGPKSWQLVDYKLAIGVGKDPASETLTRYAWQAGLYARVAAEILGAAPESVDATLAFLRDEKSSEPRSVESLGHARISNETLKHVLTQYAGASNCAQPLELPAQMWQPGDVKPVARTAALCKKQHCPYVSRCF